MRSLLELFVSVDDFCQFFLPFWERKLMESGSKKRRRVGQLRISEIMTIIIYFHQSHYRNFKAYYAEYVCQHLRGEFPKLVSYERFVSLLAAFGVGTLERLSEEPLWRLSRTFLHRLHRLASL
jgi:hypothetical protein